MEKNSALLLTDFGKSLFNTAAHLMSSLPPMRSLELLLTDSTGTSHLPSLFRTGLLFPNILYGLFPSCTCEINTTDLGRVPFGTPGLTISACLAGSCTCTVLCARAAAPI